MAGYRSPINQNDALPLLTVSQFVQNFTIQPVAPSQITVTNGKTVKQWAPSAFGINGNFSSNVADPRSAAQAFMVSNFIDLTGMTMLTFTLACKITGAGGDTNPMTWNIFMVPYIDDPLNPGTPVNFIPTAPLSNDNMSGTYGQAAFPKVGQLTRPLLKNTPPYPYVSLAACCVGLGVDQGVGFQSVGAFTICKFWFNSTSTGQDPALNYITLWGQG